MAYISETKTDMVSTVNGLEIFKCFIQGLIEVKECKDRLKQGDSLNY